MKIGKYTNFNDETILAYGIKIDFVISKSRLIHQLSDILYNSVYVDLEENNFLSEDEKNNIIIETNEKIKEYKKLSKTQLLKIVKINLLHYGYKGQFDIEFIEQMDNNGEMYLLIKKLVEEFVNLHFPEYNKI